MKAKRLLKKIRRFCITAVVRPFTMVLGSIDESLKFETIYKSITGKCLRIIDNRKIKINENGFVDKK